MYDDEPRAFCNVPLSGTVGILSSLVLLSQVLCLFLIFSNNFFIYFFELFIAFAMVFFLSQGVRNRKAGHLTIYLAYLAIYVFMMIFIVFAIIIDLSFLPSYKRHCRQHQAMMSTTTPAAHAQPSNRIVITSQHLEQSSDVDCNITSGAFWADIWTSVVLSILSIIIACIQMRYTLLLYKHIRTHAREQRSTLNVSYQHFVPGAPPRYTPQSPHTIQTAPVQVVAGPLPAKTSHPDVVVATLQPESLATTAVQPPKTLPSEFLRMESPPEYTEVAGPSESTCQTPLSPRQETMDDIDLNEVRPPSRVDLLK
ncbi:hypothetical protein Q1695_008449 [Nippostrongylus brasiliensis]|nr:hypothetical protein Q1695_008449 [Nippostrongylus brasiliensis]